MPELDPRKLPRVLYIEDDETSRVLARRLPARHYLMLEAVDPLNGLQLADETRPHLILLDQPKRRATFPAWCWWTMTMPGQNTSPKS